MNNSTNKTITPKTYLNTLVFIHAALLLGVLLFTLFIYVNGEGFVVGFSNGKSVFVYLVPTLSILCYFLSNYLFNKQLRGIIKIKPLRDRLMLYQQACIIRYAFLEGAAFIGSIAYMLLYNIFYLVISLLLILYLFKLRPTQEKVMGDLSLSLEEQQWFLIDNNEPK